MLGIEMQNDRTWQKWISYVREVLSCLDDSGNFRFLPGAGGYYDQDIFFLTIWQMVRIEFLIAKRDQNFLATLRAQNGKS